MEKDLGFKLLHKEILECCENKKDAAIYFGDQKIQSHPCPICSATDHGAKCPLVAWARKEITVIAQLKATIAEEVKTSKASRREALQKKRERKAREKINRLKYCGVATNDRGAAQIINQIMGHDGPQD